VHGQHPIAREQSFRSIVGGQKSLDFSRPVNSLFVFEQLDGELFPRARAIARRPTNFGGRRQRMRMIL